MKTKGLITMALIMVLAGNARAQSNPGTPGYGSNAGKIWLGANAGIGMPFGEFGNIAGAGFTIGLTGDYMVHSLLALGGELGLQRYGGDNDREKELSALYGTPASLTINVIPVTVHAKYFLPANANLAPFVRAGLGLYHLSTKVDAGGTKVDESTTRVGLQFGAGADFNTSTSVRYGVDVLYHYIATKDVASNVLTIRGQLLFGLAGR
jgi:opacity protein-like surface antigen